MGRRYKLLGQEGLRARAATGKVKTAGRRKVTVDGSHHGTEHPNALRHIASAKDLCDGPKEVVVSENHHLCQQRDYLMVTDGQPLLGIRDVYVPSQGSHSREVVHPTMHLVLEIVLSRRFRRIREITHCVPFLSSFKRTGQYNLDGNLLEKTKNVNTIIDITVTLFHKTVQNKAEIALHMTISQSPLG
jgi:hypothetical protein